MVSENSARGDVPDAAVARAAHGASDHRIAELRGRIAQLERPRDPGAALATLPAFASLLPGGALRAGSVYSVVGSMTLLMGLLAAPSAEGAWCGVVGVPEFGVEAASRFGIELSRLVLVPRPAESWLAVTAALADALTVVVTRPSSRVRETDAARMAARLRQRGAALIAFSTAEARAPGAAAGGAGAIDGEWPGVEARLSIVSSSWDGIGFGHGYPRQRLVTVVSAVRGGRLRRAALRFPGELAPLERAEAASMGAPATVQHREAVG